MLRTVLAFAIVAASALAQAPAGKDVISEVHVISLDDSVGKPAPVHVDRPGVQVTLVLSGHRSIDWVVSASEKTKIAKVILAGDQKQTAKVPTGTIVEERFRQAGMRQPALEVRCTADARDFRDGILAVHKETGQEVRSFQGQAKLGVGEGFAVSRVSDDARLSPTFPDVSKPDDLPKVRFQATRGVGVGEHRVAASFGDFTQDGPDKASLRPLPRRIVRAVADPKGKKLYGLDGHTLHEIDPATMKAKELTKEGELSWATALTYDSKRDRVVIVSRDQLLEYDVATGKVGGLAALPRRIELGGLAYHAADDMLYALGQARPEEGLPVFFQFNAQGAGVSSTRLGAPMFPGVATFQGAPENRIQLVSTGTHLAALIDGPQRDRGSGKSEKSTSYLYFINPKNDTVTLGWKE